MKPGQQGQAYGLGMDNKNALLDTSWAWTPGSRRLGDSGTNAVWLGCSGAVKERCTVSEHDRQLVRHHHPHDMLCKGPPCPPAPLPQTHELARHP